MKKEYSHPRLAEIFLKLLTADGDREALMGDCLEIFQDTVRRKGRLFGYIWYWSQVLRLFPPYVLNLFYWWLTMLKNYVKISFRNLLRFKLYSFINIFGLAVGLCCCIIIVLFVRDELSFDRFHLNAERIFRVVVDFHKPDKIDRFAHTPAPLAPALISEFPEVEAVVRFAAGQKELITYGEKNFWELGLMKADPAVFRVFSFPLIRGNPDTALEDQSAIVISERMARKYFAGEDPMGKIITVGNTRRNDYRVAGIMADIPANSQIQFDCLISFANQKGNIEWGQWNYNTYILLASGYSAEPLEQRLPGLVGKYRGEMEQKRNILQLQPLTDIHLHSNLRSDLASNRKISHLYIFSGIALLILMIACINFMNLVTAKSSIRQKEVGLRKVVGAGTGQLLRQYLGESVFLSLLAFLFSLLLAAALLPIFNALADKELVFGQLFDISLLPELVGLSILVGLLSGIYPAFLISRFQPLSVLSRAPADRRSGRSPLLRQVLVVFQFSVSIIFLCSTVVLHNQLHFIKNKSLGYEKNQLLVVPIFYDDVKPRYQLFKDEIERSSQVISATATSFLPGEPSYRQNVWWEGISPEADNYMQYMSWIPVDSDFLSTLQIELVAGRNFIEESQNDSGEAYLLNESAARQIGWQNPLGRSFEIRGLDKRGTVVGIISDFHFQSLHHKIVPMALTIYPDAFERLLIRVSTDGIGVTIEGIRKKWQQLFPGRIFKYSFFDESFDRVYNREIRVGKIFNYVALLAILISCIGLFGIASILTAQRTKEIGIRKVLGASVTGVLALLSREFLKLVLIANLIALPSAYIIMNNWIRTFEYRVTLSGWIFLITGLVSLFIALFSVGYQSLKAALSNPVDALKYE